MGHSNKTGRNKKRPSDKNKLSQSGYRITVKQGMPLDCLRKVSEVHATAILERLRDDSSSVEEKAASPGGPGGPGGPGD